ncbi:DUF1801 domain-containing protein [uncultured Vibrio sp.]|uniref:DUF1801 domain-containing protein n=1 Tax=uncultured Vibrio sp. TaxID=114054 RepID=UPI0025ED5FBD|nr:DUF1801 domain-containing protein [uncultured Vibrio sp.]
MNEAIQSKFDSYPNEVKPKMLELRALILDVIDEVGCTGVEEALKWGEPSFVVKEGSTIRIDWKMTKPTQYCVYFNCKTKLVDTFRELYSDCLVLQGNRAIVLDLNQPLPIAPVKHCIELSLRYHTIKHLPLLGAQPV